MDEREIIEEQDVRPCLKNPKKCSDCKRIKEASEFAMGSYTRNGRKIARLSSVCRKCASKRAKKWRIKHQEHYNEYQREYHKNRKALLDSDSVQGL